MRTTPMNHSRERAKRILRHYLAQIHRTIGLAVNADVMSEWEELVDALVDAARDELLLAAQEEQITGKKAAR